MIFGEDEDTLANRGWIEVHGGGEGENDRFPRLRVSVAVFVEEAGRNELGSGLATANENNRGEYEDEAEHPKWEVIFERALRDRAKITSHFSLAASGHLRPLGETSSEAPPQTDEACERFETAEPRVDS